MGLLLYSVQFGKNLCGMEIIPKCWVAVSCPVSLGGCSYSWQMLNQATFAQHHVLVDFKSARCLSSRNSMLLWAGRGAGSFEAVFPPVSGLIMLCPYVTFYFAVVFHFSLSFPPPQLGCY